MVDLTLSSLIGNPTMRLDWPLRCHQLVRTSFTMTEKAETPYIKQVVQPRLGTQNAIEIKKCKGPLKEELKPNDPNEEMRLLDNKVITILIGIPILEVNQKVWEETSR